MAQMPTEVHRLIEHFGPHRADPAGKRLETDVEPDRLVKTHCCFCGQQCGIQLKVKDEEVIGFEPWEDFPFNRGMLCPKASAGISRARTPTACSTPTAATLRPTAASGPCRTRRRSGSSPRRSGASSPATGGTPSP